MRRVLVVAGVVLVLLGWWALTKPKVVEDLHRKPAEESPDPDDEAHLEGVPRATSLPTAAESPPHFTLQAFGIVIDDRRRPQARVTVVALEQSRRIGWGTGETRALRAFHRPIRRTSRVVARTTTDSEGRFRLEGLASDRAHQIQARPEPPLGWVSAWFHPTYIAHEEIELVVKKGSATRLRVVDAESRGMPAWIDVWAGGGRRAAVESARTDEEGRYVTPVLPPGRVTLLARVPGVASVRRTVQAPHADEVVLQLGGGGSAAVAGTVRDEAGSPLAGAEVVISTIVAAGGSLTRATRTDPAGAYRFDGLPAGTLSRVVASAPGHLLGAFGAGNRKLEANTVIEADVVLLPGHPIRGRVVDGQGVPIGNVRVFAATAEYPPEHAHEDLTDAKGYFDVGPFPAGPVTLGTQRAGWYQVEKMDGRIRADRPHDLTVEVDGPEEVEVVLLRGLTVPGRCVDPEDHGVAGMVVTATPDWTKLGGLYPLWSTAARAVRTRSQGAFTFEGLAPGVPWAFEAKGAGHEGKMGIAKPWARDETVDPVVVPVFGTGTIRGRVVDPAGRGVPDLPVSSGGTQRTRTSGDGSFELTGLRPRTWTLRVPWTQGRRVGTVEVGDLQPGETREGVEIRVPSLARITGTLVTASGEPTPNATVVLRPISEAMPFSQAQTDAQGRFEIRVWGDGPFEVTIEGQTLGRRVGADAGDLRLIRPTPSPVLEVRIVDPKGTPVPRIDIDIRHRAGATTTSSTVTLDGGVLRLEGFQRSPGTRLRFTKPRDAAGAPLNLRRREIVLEEGQNALSVRLEAGATIHGVMMDEAGAPVPDVPVEAVSTITDGIGHGNVRATGQTDAEGRFEILGLPRTPAVVSTPAASPWLPPPPIEVDGIGEEAVLRVLRGLPFDIRVTDADGEPVPEVGVRVRGAWQGRRWSRFGRTDQSGQVTLEGLAPGGGYSVRARPRGAGAQRFPEVEIEDVPYGNGELEVVLRPGLWIEGEVLDPDGGPITGGRVQAAQGLEHHVASVRLDGTSNHFALGPLAPGTYQVHATRSGGWRESVLVEVDVPAQGVRLVLTREVRIEGRVLNIEGRTVNAQCTDGLYADGANLPEDGSFAWKIRDLPVALYAADREGTVCAMVENVRAGDGPFELRLVEADTITGRVQGEPPDGEPCWVNAYRGHLVLFGNLADDGTFRIAGVPPDTGPWRLELRTEERLLARKQGIRAGATGITLTLPAASD